MATATSEKQLTRVREGAYIGGVCTGLAEYFDCDTIVVRISAILLTVITVGIALIVYCTMWANLPIRDEAGGPYDVTPESAESSAFGCVDCIPGLDADRFQSIPLVARLAVAVGLMLLFLLVSMGVAPLIPNTNWWQFWPLGLLMLGLCLIIIPIRSSLETGWHALGVVVTAIAASIFPMSLGIISWNTVPLAFSQFWLVVVLSLLVLALGFYRENDMLVLLSAFIFVLFCLLGLTLCVIPGEVQSLLFQTPMGPVLHIGVVR